MNSPIGKTKMTAANDAERIIDVLDRPDFRELETQLERLLAMGTNSAGYPVARPADCGALTELFRRAFDKHRRHFETGYATTIERYLSLLDRFERSPLQSYGGEQLQVEFLKARVFLTIGRAEEALAIIEPWAERPYRIDGAKRSIAEAFQLDLQARLMTGRLDEVRQVALGRVLFLAEQQSPALGLTRRFAAALSLSAGSGGPNAAVRPWARFGAKAYLWQRRSVRKGPLSKAFRFVVANAALLLSDLLLFVAAKLSKTRPAIQLWPGSTPAAPIAPHLVTRPIGGLGDILMMAPGLAALARRYGQPVPFAVPAKFHAAFADNPDIQLLDSDGPIDLGRYTRWSNLGLCPAARYESRRTPRIERGRVELFARGMGVRRQELERAGQTPRVDLSPNQRLVRDDIRALAAGRQVIGVALHSREAYRDYPGMNRLLRALAERHLVLAIHGTPVALPPSPNIMGWFSRSLPDAIAGIAACDAFVSVDTALYHFAGGLGVPAVAIFGPTSAKIRSLHMPKALPIEAEGMACRPCWRNEDERCQMSGGFDSVCMASISTIQVLDGVERMLSGAPARAA